jgi:hypothetical protein
MFKSELDSRACEERLLSAGRPGHLEIWSDHPSEVKIRLPPAYRWHPFWVFFRIILHPDHGATAIGLRSDIPRLLKVMFWLWFVVAGGIAGKLVASAALGLTHGHSHRLPLAAITSPLLFVLSTGVMLLARSLDGRALRRTVVDVIRREVGAVERAA